MILAVFSSLTCNFVIGVELGTGVTWPAHPLHDWLEAGLAMLSHLVKLLTKAQSLAVRDAISYFPVC